MQWGVHLFDVTSSASSTILMWIPFDAEGASFRESQPELWLVLLQMFARCAMTKLALAYSVQYARATPLTMPLTCTHCAFGRFCRDLRSKRRVGIPIKLTQ